MFQVNNKTTLATEFHLDEAPGPDSPPHVLILDDQPDIRLLLEDVLQGEGYEVSQAENLEQALELIERESFDTVIVDIYLDDDDDQTGLSFIPTVNRHQPHAPVIVISGLANMDDVMEALKAGAYDMLCKPFNVLDVVNAVGRAVEKKRMAVENEHLVTALRQERDLLEHRVLEATREQVRTIETLRLLNEQVATMFEMSQATVAEGSTEEVVRQVFGRLRRMIDFKGAFCVLYDIRAQGINLTYCDGENVGEFSRDMVELLREHHMVLVEQVEQEEKRPIDKLYAMMRELYPGEWPGDEFMMMPLHAPQTLLGVVGLVRRDDSVDLTLAEERILGIAISQLLAAVEQRNYITRTGQLAGLGELISEIAHDLRNPMTSLRGFSRMLNEGWCDREKRTRCLEEISINLSRMESLVAELVNFYNPKEMNMVPMDVHALLDKALDVSEFHLEQNQVRVERHYAEGEQKILGLTRNLMEAFINLIINACQSMEGGGRLALTTLDVLNGEHQECVRRVGNQATI